MTSPYLAETYFEKVAEEQMILYARLINDVYVRRWWFRSLDLLRRRLGSPLYNYKTVPGRRTVANEIGFPTNSPRNFQPARLTRVPDRALPEEDSTLHRSLASDG